jgi:hypothetical protein
MTVDDIFPDGTSVIERDNTESSSTFFYTEAYLCGKKMILHKHIPEAVLNDSFLLGLAIVSYTSRARDEIAKQFEKAGYKVDLE